MRLSETAENIMIVTSLHLAHYKIDSDKKQAFICLLG